MSKTKNDIGGLLFRRIKPAHKAHLAKLGVVLPWDCDSDLENPRQHIGQQLDGITRKGFTDKNTGMVPLVKEHTRIQWLIHLETLGLYVGFMLWIHPS